jgi:hypothetical protein
VAMPKHKPSVDELRHMLKGKKWSDFKLRMNYKKQSAKRFYNAGHLFFRAQLVRYASRPALKVTACNQIVVLKFITENLYKRLTIHFESDVQWAVLDKGFYNIALDEGSPAIPVLEPAETNDLHASN